MKLSFSCTDDSGEVQWDTSLMEWDGDIPRRGEKVYIGGSQEADICTVRHVEHSVNLDDDAPHGLHTVNVFVKSYHKESRT